MEEIATVGQFYRLLPFPMPFSCGRPGYVPCDLSPSDHVHLRESQLQGDKVGRFDHSSCALTLVTELISQLCINKSFHVFLFSNVLFHIFHGFYPLFHPKPKLQSHQVTARSISVQADLAFTKEPPVAIYANLAKPAGQWVTFLA